MLQIVQAETRQQLDQAGELFREYAESLDFELCLVELEKEVSALPAEYAPPSGRLLLAILDGRAAGCVALKRITKSRGELKRLYVRPEFRRGGIGRALVEAAVEEARTIGYSRIRLYTLTSMRKAVSLYHALGFEDVRPRPPELPEFVRLLELDIRPPKSLIDKLGVKPGSRVSVLGVRDEEFWKQLRERSTEIAEGTAEGAAGEAAAGDSDLVFFMAEGIEDLANLGQLRSSIKANGGIWVVSPRGTAGIKETDVIEAAKRAGLVDTKVVRFSETHTALKLVIPLARR